MPKKPEDSHSVVHLSENGPVPAQEPPVRSFGENVRELIGTLNITGGPGGGGSNENVPGGLTEIACLREEHDLRAVVEVWVDVNADRLDELPASSVRQRLRTSVPYDQRDVVSEVLSEKGYTVDRSDTGGKQTEPFECDLCGASVPDIASHLPNCPER